VKVIIISPQWQEVDILAAIECNAITCETILIEHGGRLVDFIHDSQPYHAVG